MNPVKRKSKQQKFAASLPHLSDPQSLWRMVFQPFPTYQLKPAEKDIFVPITRKEMEAKVIHYLTPYYPVSDRNNQFSGFELLDREVITDERGSKWFIRCINKNIIRLVKGGMERHGIIYVGYFPGEECLDLVRVVEKMPGIYSGSQAGIYIPIEVSQVTGWLRECIEKNICNRTLSFSEINLFR